MKILFLLRLKHKKAVRFMTKTSHGYTLIYVGKKHHLADCRGYAYLHRVNAEKKIGRKLKKGEEVHHKRGKDNNEPCDLTIKKNHAHHFLEHRKRKDLKHPDQPNRYIKCLCGCGCRLLKYDTSNRPRKYIAGHNPSDACLQNKIKLILLNREMPLAEIIKKCKGKKESIKATLSKMVKSKKVVRIEWGIYGPVGSAMRVRRNHIIKCACGCGAPLWKYDAEWRERKYISGHNNPRGYGKG